MHRDVLERCELRIADSDREALYAAVSEIKRLREKADRMRVLFSDIFNCVDACDAMPSDLRTRLWTEMDNE